MDRFFPKGNIQMTEVIWKNVQHDNHQGNKIKPRRCYLGSVWGMVIIKKKSNVGEDDAGGQSAMYIGGVNSVEINMKVVWCFLKN